MIDEAVKSKIYELMGEHSSEMIQQTLALIRTDTTNPPGNEIEIAQQLRDFLESLNFAVEFHEKVPGRTNVLAHRRFGKSGKRVILVGHMDTVPVTDKTGWKCDPLIGAVIGDTIVGRGAADMKGPISGMLYAAKILSALEVASQHNGSLTICLVADEETGGFLGSQFLIDKGIVLGEDYDLAIVVGSSDLDVAISHKGQLIIELRAEGEPAHASMPKRGKSATLALATLLTRLEKEDFTFGKTHELLGENTVALATTLQGGSAENIIADSCSATVDVRYLPGIESDMFLNVIESVSKPLVAQSGVELTSCVTHNSKPCSIDPQHEGVQLLKEAASAMTSRNCKVFGLKAANDAWRFSRSAGIPTIADFGPGSLEKNNLHGINEWISITSLEQAACSLALFLHNYLQ